MPDRTAYMDEGSSVPEFDPARRERSTFYGSKRWAKHRKAYLTRNPLCAKCLEKGLVVAATIVHHVVERLVRPDLAWDWSNFQGLCRPCHTRHHNESKQ